MQGGGRLTLTDQLLFYRIKFHTLRHGEITALHIAMLGIASQMLLGDIREKTKRGLRSVARDGRSTGGRCYAYRIAPTDDGGRGGRAIQADQAAVVVRIFGRYAAGVSPKQIALDLNAEGIAAPRGGAWGPSAINGDRSKGTGILNNELYVGRLVWGRQEWLKHPDTGKRIPRQADEGDRLTIDVPELRIVDDELWERVKARQAELDKRGTRAVTAHDNAEGLVPFWAKQRPKYLFSGLMVCAECGGGFSKISAQHFGCSAARNKGPTACTNLLTIRRDVLESSVITTLRDRLMHPGLFKQFVATFTAEWNRQQADAAAGTTDRQQELARVGQQIERIVDAIAEGTAGGSLKQRLTTLEARRATLESELAGASAPAPRLHPSLAEHYRARMAELAEAVSDDAAPALREQVRNLVEQIRLIPEDGKLRIQVRGELGAILELAEGARMSEPGIGKRPGRVPEAFMVQVKMDAGTGFEPVTFRL